MRGLRPAKSFAGAVWAVAIADVSMSLDNVLAVAGAAREHPGILIVGLIFAVALMGIAANIIARYIERYHWIAYVGLVVILYVAGKMIYEGWVDPQVALGRCSADGRGEAPCADTIFALSSGRPPAAIAIIRVSGPAAHDAARAAGRRIAAAAPRRAAQLARSARRRVLDEALVLRFDGPASATGEDIVEFQCHGGRAVVDAMLAALARASGLARGRAGRIHPPRLRQRPDRPDRGRRAGRSARGRDRSPAPRRAGAGRAAGCGARSSSGRRGWSSLSARAEAAIDYVDEEDGAAAIRRFAATARRSPTSSMRMARRPRIEPLRDGVRVVVAGPPNAGKSALSMR